MIHIFHFRIIRANILKIEVNNFSRSQPMRQNGKRPHYLSPNMPDMTSLSPDKPSKIRHLGSSRIKQHNHPSSGALFCSRNRRPYWPSQARTMDS